MKLQPPFLALPIAILLASADCHAQARSLPSPAQERITTSFMLALGRPPTPGELPRWSSDGDQPLPELLARHRADLQVEPSHATAVRARAERDAFGRPPGTGGPAAAPGSAQLYCELVEQHVRTLADRTEAYADVIDRAYRTVLGRGALDIEFDYWKARPAMSFVLLVGCIDNWARRNAPGLMATTGVPSVSIHCRYLSTLRLSPSVAREARRACRLSGERKNDPGTLHGRTVIAPTASGVTGVGGIHFVVTGGSMLGPLPAAGG